MLKKIFTRTAEEFTAWDIHQARILNTVLNRNEAYTIHTYTRATQQALHTALAFLLEFKKAGWPQPSPVAPSPTAAKDRTTQMDQDIIVARHLCVAANAHKLVALPFFPAHGPLYADVRSAQAKLSRVSTFLCKNHGVTDLAQGGETCVLKELEKWYVDALAPLLGRFLHAFEAALGDLARWKVPQDDPREIPGKHSVKRYVERGDLFFAPPLREGLHVGRRVKSSERVLGVVNAGEMQENGEVGVGDRTLGGRLRVDDSLSPSTGRFSRASTLCERPQLTEENLNALLHLDSDAADEGHHPQSFRARMERDFA